jgi:hypothetical protein
LGLRGRAPLNFNVRQTYAQHPISRCWVPPVGGLPVVGPLFSTNYPNALYAATIAFVLTWLVISVANLWVGVSRAGYTVSDELPIFLLIFGVPAAVAVVLKWRFF